MEKVKEEIGGVIQKLNFVFRKDSINEEGSFNSVECSPHRNSDFIKKRSFLYRSSKMSNRSGDLASANSAFTPEVLVETEVGNGVQAHSFESLKEKLNFLEEELERQRRIVDRHLINIPDERMSDEINQENSLSGSVRYGRRVEKGEAGDDLRKEVLRTIKEMEGKMNECKVPFEVFNRQDKVLSEKIRCLELLVVNKCDKNEVKNAFSFLEKKLKELIILVAND